MLGGVEMTSNTLLNAKEMIELADTKKKKKQLRLFIHNKVIFNTKIELLNSSIFFFYFKTNMRILVYFKLIWLE